MACSEPRSKLEQFYLFVDDKWTSLKHPEDYTLGQRLIGGRAISVTIRCTRMSNEIVRLINAADEMGLTVVAKPDEDGSAIDIDIFDVG